MYPKNPLLRFGQRFFPIPLVRAVVVHRTRLQIIFRPCWNPNGNRLLIQHVRRTQQGVITVGTARYPSDESTRRRGSKAHRGGKVVRETNLFIYRYGERRFCSTLWRPCILFPLFSPLTSFHDGFNTSKASNKIMQ